MPNVTDYRSILAYHSNAAYRWNSIGELGSGAIVTYAFAEGASLPSTSETYFSTTSTSSFNTAQRHNFYDIIEIFEQTAGLKFIEVDQDPMINVFSVDGSSWGGWANYPVAAETYTSSGRLVIDSAGDYHEGSYGFHTLLHELGHAVGLSHSFDGPYVLDTGIDTSANTVMSYTIVSNATDLSPLDVDALQHIYGEPLNTRLWTIDMQASGMALTAQHHHDELMGVLGENTISGGAGRDTIAGRDEGDLLVGDLGNDLIMGQGGNDDLRGGAHNDTLWGSGPNSAYTIDDDTLIGGRGRDELHGQDGEDKLFGHQGDDVLIGGGMDDMLHGKNGSDILQGDGDNALYDGDDFLMAGKGHDVLMGDGGSDTLVGGRGDDTMTGGGQSDLFIYDVNSAGDRDVITDFVSGTDQIDISRTGFTAGDAVVVSDGSSVVMRFDGVGGFEIAIQSGSFNAGLDLLT